MNETFHVRLAQSHARFLCTYDGESCALGVAPAFPDTICPRRVANIGAVPGLIVTVGYYSNTPRITTETYMEQRVRVRVLGLGFVLGLGLVLGLPSASVNNATNTLLYAIAPSVSLEHLRRTR